MIRLFLLWVVITSIVIAIRYFATPFIKHETTTWTFRIMWIGGIVAVMLGMGIFLERL